MAKHPFSLSGRVALVAGGSRGLGFEIARSLGAAGAALFVNGRDGRALEAASAALRAEGSDAAPLAFDVTDGTAVAAAAARIAAERGRLDILVDAVGMRQRAPFADLTLADFRAMTEANLIAAASLAQAALPLMQRQGRGRILFVTSIAGLIARAGDAAYTAAKGGLAALTKALAVEYGPHGITTNALAPGFFMTEANRALIADEEVDAYLKRRCPLGRWGEPHEIGGAALFLVSDAASYVNGHVLTVDGGLTASF